jgi:hypothetical protein
MDKKKIYSKFCLSSICGKCFKENAPLLIEDVLENQKEFSCSNVFSCCSSYTTVDIMWQEIIESEIRDVKPMNGSHTLLIGNGLSLDLILVHKKAYYNIYVTSRPNECINSFKLCFPKSDHVEFVLDIDKSIFTSPIKKVFNHQFKTFIIGAELYGKKIHNLTDTKLLLEDGVYDFRKNGEGLVVKIESINPYKKKEDFLKEEKEESKEEKEESETESEEEPFLTIKEELEDVFTREPTEKKVEVLKEEIFQEKKSFKCECNCPSEELLKRLVSMGKPESFYENISKKVEKTQSDLITTQIFLCLFFLFFSFLIFNKIF